MGTVKEEFQKEVSVCLDRLTDQLVPVLKQLIEYPHVSEVKALDFEVFCDGFTFGLPAVGKGLAACRFHYKRALRCTTTLESLIWYIRRGSVTKAMMPGQTWHCGSTRRKMMIQSVESYIRYFDGIRRRTLTFARAIPPDRIDWSPQEDAFTFGDILRHLAAVEEITICAVVNKRWKAYPGHALGLASEPEEIIAYLEATHAEAMSMLRALPDTELQKPRTALAGRTLKAWRLLMSIIEHEIHHRSQLASYLTMLGLAPPQIFGLEVDDVARMSTELAGDHPLE